MIPPLTVNAIQQKKNEKKKKDGALQLCLLVDNPHRNHRNRKICPSAKHGGI